MYVCVHVVLGHIDKIGYIYTLEHYSAAKMYRLNAHCKQTNAQKHAK